MNAAACSADITGSQRPASTLHPPRISGMPIRYVLLDAPQVCWTRPETGFVCRVWRWRSQPEKLGVSAPSHRPPISQSDHLLAGYADAPVDVSNRRICRQEYKTWMHDTISIASLLTATSTLHQPIIRLSLCAVSSLRNANSYDVLFSGRVTYVRPRYC